MIASRSKLENHYRVLKTVSGESVPTAVTDILLLVEVSCFVKLNPIRILAFFAHVSLDFPVQSILGGHKFLISFKLFG